jgi:hypothetical protein
LAFIKTSIDNLWQTCYYPSMNKPKEFERIAKEHLRFDTLAERKSDRLDFHEVSVWSVADALDAAYKIGVKMGKVVEKRKHTIRQPITRSL